MEIVILALLIVIEILVRIRKAALATLENAIHRLLERAEMPQWVERTILAAVLAAITFYATPSKIVDIFIYVIGAGFLWGAIRAITFASVKIPKSILRKYFGTDDPAYEGAVAAAMSFEAAIVPMLLVSATGFGDVYIDHIRAIRMYLAVNIFLYVLLHDKVRRDFWYFWKPIMMMGLSFLLSLFGIFAGILHALGLFVYSFPYP